MKWTELQRYLLRNDSSEVLEETGYVSYVPAPNVLIRMQSDRDDHIYTATYFQVIPADDDAPATLVIQLEGMPEDPSSHLLIGDTLDTFESADLYVELYNTVV